MTWRALSFRSTAEFSDFYKLIGGAYNVRRTLRTYCCGEKEEKSHFYLEKAFMMWRKTSIEKKLNFVFNPSSRGSSGSNIIIFHRLQLTHYFKNGTVTNWNVKEERSLWWSWWRRAGWRERRHSAKQAQSTSNPISFWHGRFKFIECKLLKE